MASPTLVGVVEKVGPAIGTKSWPKGSPKVRLDHLLLGAPSGGVTPRRFRRLSFLDVGGVPHQYLLPRWWWCGGWSGNTKTLFRRSCHPLVRVGFGTLLGPEGRHCL